MAAAAHNPKFAKKAGVPQSAAQDFNAADKGTGLLRGAMKNYGKEKQQRNKA